MKLLVTSKWVERYLSDLRAEFPQIEFMSGDSPGDLAAVAGEAEIAFGSMSQELFRAAKRLRWIQSASAGVEWMQGVPELAASDVIVTNTRGAHAATIAEHTMGMLICLARNFHPLYEFQKQKVWQRPLEQPSVGLVGLTMGIVGLGNIGRAIAKRAHAFEMDVIAVDAHDVPRPDTVSGLQLLDGLPNLLRRSDVVVVATPLTSTTRGMLGPEKLALLKPSAYLLVMSRGGIVDEPTVARMLRSGQLAGAGFDVAGVEPLPAENELWNAPNTIITPHCSPSSAQTGANVTAILRENLNRYLAGQPLVNRVDKGLGY